jgi:hypothetical protein
MIHGGLMRGSLFILVSSLSLTLLGCDKDEPVEQPPKDYKIEITSDTRWSGYFENRTIDGHGNETIDISDNGIVCCTAQKQTEHGTLTMSVIPGGESATTTAAYGVVSVCKE